MGNGAVKEAMVRTRLQRPFIIAGVLIGAAASGGYLFYTMARAPIPQPVWTRFVNVALIMFSVIYLANLLRRLIERFMKR